MKEYRKREGKVRKEDEGEGRRQMTYDVAVAEFVTEPKAKAKVAYVMERL